MRRRDVQKKALTRALKASKATGLKLITFDTPTGVHYMRQVRSVVGCTQWPDSFIDGVSIQISCFVFVFVCVVCVCVNVCVCVCVHTFVDPLF